jgi:hypothetical protein
MALKRSESPWHLLHVETVLVFSMKDRGAVPADELDYRVTHPEDCDRLPYGEVCWFDQTFFEDDDNKPTKPSYYRARVWITGPDYYGEYDGGNEWYPVPAAEVES